MEVNINGTAFKLDPDMELVLSKEVEGNEEQTKTNHEAETKWFNFCKSCHVAMVEELKDPTNFGEFMLLLNKDASTAFQQYNHARGRTFE